MDCVEVAEVKGKVENHSKQVTLVGYRGDWAHLEFGWEVLSKVCPGNDACKALGNFVYHFEVECVCSSWLLCRRMGTTADGFVEEVEVPFRSSLGKAALVGEVEKN
jgi:hypothetical protein